MNPKPKLTILVGYPGSTKSTFAENVITAKINNNELYPEIVSQDELGNRETCIQMMKTYLTAGYDVIIDRTNINKKQRSYFIKEALKYTDNIHCIEFKAKTDECVKRILLRKAHKTIKENFTEQKVREIVRKFEDSYEKPEYSEKFQSITTIHVDNFASTTKDNSIRNRYWCGFKKALSTLRSYIANEDPKL